MNRVFMYGTLKSGQPNHYVLSEVGPDMYTFVGKGYTSTKWPLVISSEHNIPYLLDKEGEGHNIKGEVYDIDNELLAHMDRFECYPDVYGRRKVEIVMTTVESDTTTVSNTGSKNDSNRPDREKMTMECWIYFLPEPFNPTLMELERMEDYDSYGAHGKPYIPVYVPDKGWVGELEKPSS